MREKSTDHELEELKRIYKELPIGLCYFDTNLRFIHINKCLAAIHGVPVKEHLGRTISEVLPHVAAGVETQLRHVIETGEPIVGGTIDAETPAQPGVTKTFEYSFYGVRSGDDTVVGVGCVIQEITERKRAEEILQLAQFALDHASDMAIWLDPSGRLVYVNDTMCKLLGYSREELLTMDISEVDPDATLEDFARLFERMRTHGPNTFEACYRTKDGKIVPVEISTRLMEYGDKILINSLSRDITKRKRAEEKVAQLNAQLSHVHRFNEMGALASGLAHELNQPLTAIATYLHVCIEQLRSRKGSPEVIIADMEQAVQQVLRAREIIRGMRDVIGDKKLERESFDLNAAIRETLGLVKAEASTLGTNLELDLAACLPMVMANRVHVQQVVLNLVRNGMEALQEHDSPLRRVTIRTRRKPRNTVEVAVEDTGCGISGEYLEKIFDPFFTTKADGMGMGLHICRTIIERHGGRVWAESDGDNGAAIHFTLPTDDGDTQDQA